MKINKWIIGILLLVIVAVATFSYLSREQEHSATIVHIENEVDAHAQPDEAWETAVSDMIIFSGGQVRTGSESAAQLAMLEGTVRLSSDTVFTVKQSQTSQDVLRTTVGLENGRLWVNLNTDQTHEFAIETGSAVATVRDTYFSVQIADGQTLLSVAEGEATLTAQETSVTVTAGEQAVAEQEQPPAPPEPMSRDERTLWATEGQMPELAPPPPVPATLFANAEDFQAAISELGTPTIIDFEEIDTSPINNTIQNRDPFPGDTYADQGIIFSNPKSLSLYLAPGGINLNGELWNESNSLSVDQFPFDEFASGDTDDDLLVTFEPPTVAVSFILVDNGSFEDDEFIQFFDDDGEIIEQVPLPEDFMDFRAFIGIISPDIPIASINIVEGANDGDDVNYDEFTFIP